MKRLVVLSLALILLAAPIFASWQIDNRRFGVSLGIAQYVNPATVKTLASTPNTGVALPAGTKTIAVTVSGAAIRYNFNATTDPTTTVGNKLDVGGPYTITYDPGLITALKFINDAAGASTVDVEFYGEQ